LWNSCRVEFPCHSYGKDPCDAVCDIKNGRKSEHVFNILMIRKHWHPLLWICTWNIQCITHFYVSEADTTENERQQMECFRNCKQISNTSENHYRISLNGNEMTV
jgi:hypothetical protein